MSRWPYEKRFVESVMARGYCEACLVHVLPECSGVASEAHHIVTRSRGVGWSDLWNPEVNGLAVSHAHHMWIHANPKRSDALGFLKHSWDVETVKRGG